MVRITGKPSKLIAQGIPTPASMCYDSGANQLVIPLKGIYSPRRSR